MTTPVPTKPYNPPVDTPIKNPQQPEPKNPK